MSFLSIPSRHCYEKLLCSGDKDLDLPMVKYDKTLYEVSYTITGKPGQNGKLVNKRTEFHLSKYVPPAEMFARMTDKEHLYKTGTFDSIKNYFSEKWRCWVATKAFNRDYGTYKTLKSAVDENGKKYPSKIELAGEKYTVEIHMEYHEKSNRSRSSFTISPSNKPGGYLAKIQSDYRRWKLENMVNEGYQDIHDLSVGTELQEMRSGKIISKEK